jgi:toxin ParE1/3/4
VIRVDFTSAAQSEFTELIRFYDRQGGTIASDFATELERVVERIVDFPDAGAPYSSGTRRILLNRFPVAVVYRARGSTLEVLALAHQRRRPKVPVQCPVSSRRCAGSPHGACHDAIFSLLRRLYRRKLKVYKTMSDPKKRIRELARQQLDRRLDKIRSATPQL